MKGEEIELICLALASVGSLTRSLFRDGFHVPSGSMSVQQLDHHPGSIVSVEALYSRGLHPMVDGLRLHLN